MAQLSQYFRVAVEGATTDGRLIERNWLEEMAATYNRETYAARINMEHIRGITADKPFKAYGDVVSLKTEEIDIQIGGETMKRLALFAQIEPTDELKAMNADKQKLYTSVEIQPNFAGSGKAYLVGLAVTDSPASLGTEMLKFAASQGENNPLAGRKQNAGNLFGEAVDSGKLTFAEVADTATPANDGDGTLLAGVKAFFQSLAPTAPATPSQPATPPSNDNSQDKAANDNFSGQFAGLVGAVTQLTSAVETMGTNFNAKLDKLQGEHDALKASIDTTAAPHTPRPLATGTETGRYRTDC